MKNNILTSYLLSPYPYLPNIRQEHIIMDDNEVYTPTSKWVLFWGIYIKPLLIEIGCFSLIWILIFILIQLIKLG